jgi:multiple RNA-binding domain-containing protein 1
MLHICCTVHHELLYYRSVALVEFLAAADAKRAFKKLAYTRYLHVPLYLEWAPEAVFINNSSSNSNSNSDSSSKDGTAATAATQKTALVRALHTVAIYNTSLLYSSVDLSL